MLIVIVVLLVGILAVVQIFPSGLRILAYNRNAVIATNLAQNEAERLVGRSEQLPEQIIPVTYAWTGTVVQVQNDPSRSPRNLGIVPGEIRSDAFVYDAAGHQLGYWPYLSGPNLFRRIVGEGGRVPAPRQVGDYFGGLMILQFTPIVYNEAAPGQFLVYGADMVRKLGQPQAGDSPQRFEYFLENADQSTANLYLPADQYSQRLYRLALSCYGQVGATVRKFDITNVTITVPPNNAVPSSFYSVPISSVVTLPGATFVGAELESVRIARQYDKLLTSETFTDPYQFKLLDANLGLILFSDEAYRAYELRNGRRVPLEAHVNYDVFDWRVIRDEFRVPEGNVPQVKLALGTLKIKGNRDVDDTVYLGLKLDLPTGTGGPPERRDIAVMDMDSGGILLEKSATRSETGGGPKQLMKIDRSIGLITFMDADNDPTNGVTGEVVFPGSDTPTDVNLTGRSLRAMYQSRGEWSVQMLKAPSLFHQTITTTGGLETDGYYVGGSDGPSGGNPTRIYFAQSQAGNRVTVDTIWYRQPSDTTARALENQSFVIQSQPADPTGLAYIDIKSVDNLASAFDSTTYGFSVTGIKGASITVRVLWNPTNLSFTTDTADNLGKFEIWGREWRQTSTETYVRRPGE